MNLSLPKALIQKLAFAYTILIVLLVTLPINGEDQFLGKLNDNYVLQIRLDYISHVLLFMPWVTLIWWGWELSLKSMNVQVLSVFAALGFAIACEYIQLPLTYRTFNINDLFSNSLGVLLGFLFVWGWQKMGLGHHKNSSND